MEEPETHVEADSPEEAMAIYQEWIDEDLIDPDGEMEEIEGA